MDAGCEGVSGAREGGEEWRTGGLGRGGGKSELLAFVLAERLVA